MLAEATFLLPWHTLRRRLADLLAELNVQPCPEPAGGHQWAQVLDWMLHWAEHWPDWADAQLVVLSAANRRYRIWTYDREFHVLWRRPDGSPVPLAIRPR